MRSKLALPPPLDNGRVVGTQCCSQRTSLLHGQRDGESLGCSELPGQQSNTHTHMNAVRLALIISVPFHQRNELSRLSDFTLGNYSSEIFVKTDILRLKLQLIYHCYLMDKHFFEKFLSVFTSVYLTGRGSGGRRGTANSANAQRKIREIS